MSAQLLHQVLIVEGSTSVRELTAARIRRVPNIDAICISTYQKAAALLADGTDYLCAVVGLVLDDAANGEVIELTRKCSIPTIVLTGASSETLISNIDSSLVIDYVIKESIKQIDYIAEIVKNTYAHQRQTILVVDDSTSQRNYLTRLLKNLRYQVITAENGAVALEVLQHNESIPLALIDQNMPEMSGLQLIEKIRLRFDQEELALIGISTNQDDATTVKFLKAGANDYLSKPFSTDEFYARVNQHCRLVRYISTLNELASTDYLTKLKNRHTLFSQGKLLHSNALRGSFHLAVGMIDADNFKTINDRHGHATGDLVLIGMADKITEMFRKTDVIARFGGEEFICVAVVNSAADAREVFERVRKQVEQMEINAEGTTIKVTVSIGVTTKLGDSLEQMISLADEAVYQAKTTGRNRVIEL
ncbi:MAG: diguanylate cyclase [Immundisolibacteraceae bacterium]|nr:diguanylate cyclase [Immundisolibacteraceae bacterium]